MKKNLDLIIEDLRVSLEGKEIIHGLNLHVKPAEIHVIMGPNGSGKSTFTYGVMGAPNYQVLAKSIRIGSIELKDQSPDKRAKSGLLLAFQNPLAIPGVSVSNLLRSAYKSIHPQNYSVIEFHKQLLKYTKLLGIADEFLKRPLNDGFSGGEKKKMEMLQIIALKPRFVIFDEIDTGLDIDALQLVAKAISFLQKQNCGIIIITHYQRILRYVKPDVVHILKNGYLVESGGIELVSKIEEKGYAAI